MLTLTINTWRELFLYLRGIATGAGIYYEDTDADGIIIKQQQPDWWKYTIVVKSSKLKSWVVGFVN